MAFGIGAITAAVIAAPAVIGAIDAGVKKRKSNKEEKLSFEFLGIKA